MKKGLLLLFTAISSFAMNAQTATNFNCNDCSGVNHDLFTELDAGKVIVLCWVMPCSACVTPSLNSISTVQGFASTDPGRVKFYLIDDSGNTNCTALDSWANNNGIVPDASFSNSSISMTDYGVNGMPKIVVIGGSSHTVFFNQNNTFDYHDLQIAIQDGLAATGIAEHNSVFSGINLSPNPAKRGATVLSYTLTASTPVAIDIYNTAGEKVKSVSVKNETTGKHEIALDLSGLSNGVYFISLAAGESSKTVRFIIAE